MPAFLAAGASDIVATLWPLENTFGREFVRRYYTHLAHYGAAMALRSTMESFIAEDELIGRWSGFVDVGNGRVLW